MPDYSQPTQRLLRVLAQDPGTTDKGRVLTTRLAVPAESLEPGPRGHRVHVIDYDSSTRTFYRPLELASDLDPYDKADDDQLLEDPHFHQQNVYALVSNTLLTFEAALGRHVGWAFPYGTHQLKVAPHAFSEANAYYSRADEALLFGYFRGRKSKEIVFTSLSSDIVVHETTHALIDALRQQYIRPSSDDQAAFHEGFADVVALLSVFRSPELIKLGLSHVPRERDGRILVSRLQAKVLNDSFLLGLAQQMGDEIDAIKRNALRRSVTLKPNNRILDKPENLEPHARGEVLVAAVMRSFLEVWWNRITGKLRRTVAADADLSDAALARLKVDEWRVVEEAGAAAEHLLGMVIRSLDYMPPVDIEFGDFLSAALTADAEATPDDSKYSYRDVLLKTFASYGITPASTEDGARGQWQRPDDGFVYGQVHAEPMRWDRNAMFRFVWENRKSLKLCSDAFTMVQSVRPVVRRGADGFTLRECVVEYFQLLDIRAAELKQLALRAPDDMPGGQNVRLHGGGALIFDEFGHVKFHIFNRLESPKQNARIKTLWERGAFRPSEAEPHFARLHRERALRPSNPKEQW